MQQYSTHCGLLYWRVVVHHVLPAVSLPFVLRSVPAQLRSRAALPRSQSLRSRPAVLAASSTTAAASIPMTSDFFWREHTHTRYPCTHRASYPCSPPLARFLGRRVRSHLCAWRGRRDGCCRLSPAMLPGRWLQSLCSSHSRWLHNGCGAAILPKMAAI